MSSSSSYKKQRVLYRTDRPHEIRIGFPAICFPIDHPDKTFVTGDGETPVTTSIVQAINLASGEFWTQNTHYVPYFP
jgi:hypothetical protein